MNIRQWTEEDLTEPGVDHDAWERDCLAAVELWFARSSSDPYCAQLEQAELEAEYPDTALVVTAAHPQVDRHGVFRYRLWDGRFDFSSGKRTEPGDAAWYIHVWVTTEHRPEVGEVRRWTEEELTEPGVDHQAWEHDCLTAIELWFRRHPDPYTAQLERATLEGKYPQTELVVIAARPNLGRRRVFRYPLWDKAFEVVSGKREDPDSAAADVHLWIDEEIST